MPGEGLRQRDVYVSRSNGFETCCHWYESKVRVSTAIHLRVLLLGFGAQHLGRSWGTREQWPVGLEIIEMQSSERDPLVRIMRDTPASLSTQGYRAQLTLLLGAKPTPRVPSLWWKGGGKHPA